MLFGIICFILGAGIWLINLYGGGFNWGRDWPFLVLVFGIYKIWDFTWNRKRRRPKGRKNIKNILEKIEKKEIDVGEAIKRMED